MTLQQFYNLSAGWKRLIAFHVLEITALFLYISSCLHLFLFQKEAHLYYFSHMHLNASSISPLLPLLLLSQPIILLVWAEIKK